MNNIKNYINIKIFTIMACVLILQLVDSIQVKNIVLLFLSILCWFSSYMVTKTYNKKLDLLSPVILYPAFYIFIFGLAALTLSNDVGYSYRSQLDGRFYYYILLGFLFSNLGILTGFLTKKIPKTVFFKKNIVDNWAKGSQLQFWGWFILCIGIIGFIIYYGIIVGIPLLEKGDAIRHGIRPSTYGIGLAFMWLQGACFVSISSVILKRKQGLKVGLIHKLIVFFAILLTILSGYRWIVVLYFLVFVVCYHYIVKEIEFKFNLRQILFGFIFCMGLMFFIGYVGYLRFSSNEINYLNGLRAMNISEEYKYVAPAFLSLQTPVASFSFLINKVPRLHPFFYGYYTLKQVPGSSILFSRHDSTSPFVYVTNEIFDLDFRGNHGATAISILGNFYIDGGGFAIMIGTFMIGMVLTLLYVKMITIWSIYSISVYGFYLITSLKWILVGFYFGDLRLLAMMYISNHLISLKKS